jgi:hypothetical protein
MIHPAFKITLNPGIVLLSFIMLALSVIVTSLVWQKFETQLKQQARETLGTHSLDAGTGSIAVAAFALGVSNMRRRKARTALTCMTLVLLTFTVLAFTSVVQDLKFNEVPAPGIPVYSGIQLRDPNWNPLQQVAYRVLGDEFGKTRQVAPRSWFLGTQPGEQTFLELKRADRDFGAKGAVGLTPQESQVTHASDALTAGRWFQPGDTLAMILPRKIADSLRISDADANQGSARVSFSGQEYTVIGILDEDKFKKITDLDQEPLTPVDFVQMQQLQKQGKSDTSSGFQQYIHLDPDAIFFVPYQTLVDLGGDLRSVAIGYGAADSAVLPDLQNNLMKRFDMNLYEYRRQQHRGPGDDHDSDPDRGAYRPEYDARLGLRARQGDPYVLLNRPLADPHWDALHGRGSGVRNSGRGRRVRARTGRLEDYRHRPAAFGPVAELLVDLGGDVHADYRRRGAALDAVSGKQGRSGGDTGDSALLGGAGPRGRYLEDPSAVRGHRGSGTRRQRLPRRVVPVLRGLFGR